MNDDSKLDALRSQLPAKIARLLIAAETILNSLEDSSITVGQLRASPACAVFRASLADFEIWSNAAMRETEKSSPRRLDVAMAMTEASHEHH